MPMKWLLALPAFALATAGCLSAGTSDELPDPALDETAAALPALVVLDWSGHLRAGAFYELPAHFRETEPHVAPAWKSGFVLDVTEVPQDMQVSLDWTGTGKMQVMVHLPHGHEGERQGWTEYITEFSEAKHQCIRLPAEALHAGHYYLMVHSQYGANIEHTITVTLAGGAAQVLEGPHGHATTPDEAQKLVYTLTEDPDTSLACDEGV